MLTRLKNTRRIVLFGIFAASITNSYSLQKFTLKTNGGKISFFAKAPKLKKLSQEKASQLSIKTNIGKKIPVLFFDRGKNKAIVIGQGFPGKKEDAKYKAQVLDDYDILSFDYSWEKIFSFLLQPSTLCHPWKKFFWEEKKVVHAVVNFLKKKKDYKEIVGLGECYSNFTFALAQIEAEGKKEKLFTKLIFDSCWHNSRDFIEEISLDPWLPFSPQHGGAPELLKKILHSPLFHYPISLLLDLLTPNISTEPYLKKISIPLLFIHGTNDKMVPYKKVFKKIWQIPTGQKALLLTPFEHSDNMQNTFVYKKICAAFINAKSKETSTALLQQAEFFKKKFD